MADRGALTGAVNWYRGMMLSGVTPGCAVPTSYLWGAKDFALGRVAAERTAAHVTGDYTFEALNAGHWLPETRSDHVARAIIERARSAT